MKFSPTATAVALESLAQLGHPDPAASLRTLRQHLAAHAIEPVAGVQSLMRRSRLVCLGEMHDFAGRFMSAELVMAAARAGARWLFVEVYASQQAQIDAFAATGRHEQLPASAGGGQAVPMRFQQPYVEMLIAARSAGLRIVAIDNEGVSSDERDVLMAQAVQRHMRGSADRGVAIVGQLHVVPRPILGRGPSMAALLRPHLGGSLVTVGRAVPDAMARFSVWADVAGVQEPCLLSVAGSPFAPLASTLCEESLHASDFDHVFFYPADSVLAAK
jgi:hypothetical protein